MAGEDGACEALWPATTPCSGNGECVNGTCLCHPGFMSRGDLVVKDADCISVETARWMWAIVLVAWATTLVGCLILLARASTMVRKYKLRVGNLWFILSVMVEAVLLVACAALKVSDPLERRIGADPAVTFCFCLATGLFWIQAPKFVIRYLILLTLGQASQFQEIERAVQLMLCVGFASCLAPMFNLVSDASFLGTSTSVFTFAHYFGLMLAMALFHWFVSCNLLEKLLLLLEEHLQAFSLTSSDDVNCSEQERVGALRDKIKWLRTSSRHQVFSNAGIGIAMYSVPFLAHRVTFQLAVAWACIAPVCMFVAATMLPLFSASDMKRAGKVNGRFQRRAQDRRKRQVLPATSTNKDASSALEAAKSSNAFHDT